MPASTLELWTCPKCGVKLVSRNLWHSCGQATLDDWRRRMGPRGRRLYDRFEGMIAKWHLTEPGQLDAEVQSWLRRSYRLMGMQGRLKKKTAR